MNRNQGQCVSCYPRRTGGAGAWLLGCLVAVIGLALVVILFIVSGYNRAVALDEAVASQWAQVENQLQRRYDLIPNLVETVKGVAGQEEKIFLQLAEARKAYVNAATVGAKAQAAGGVESALARLLVLPENYPQLRSSDAFMKLQDQLEGTENRLSVERMRYNETVKTLNTYTRQLGGRFFSSLAGVGPAEYFEIAEAAKEVPKVDFSSPPRQDE
ncbi:MAG: LemA family protein [Pirellulaceae bacterium]|nr:LemA family protein [Pirellulaceae bacterium]